MSRPRLRLRWPAFPHPHFMAFAPLDVWARLLLAPMVWVWPRYWGRLAFALFTSFLGTVGSLPERLVLAVVIRVSGRRSGMRLVHKPGVVIVLGYFRTGTTHLHYLLSCDPRMRTPAWCEALAPQGFAASWAFLRLFMIPWISSKRPQDDMALGPSWPAEDDFALNNWGAASSLPWRFIVPSRRAHYGRFHSLEGLTPREMARWRFCQYGFCWKLSRLARGRMILLKSPSHVARVPALLELFGAENVRFIHISREPGAVIRSNTAMYERMSIYGLEDPPPAAETEEAIRAEYVRSEENYLRDLPLIPRGHIAEVRYEDLVADPLGQIERLYGELSLPYTPEFERNALTYLNSVRDYRAVHSRGPELPKGSDELRRLAARFGHDRPAIDPVPLPPGGPVRPPRAEAMAFAAACGAAVLAAAAWVGQTHVFGGQHVAIAWLVGLVIGAVAISVARVGTRRLGIGAAVLTALVIVAVMVPNAVVDWYLRQPGAYRADGSLTPVSEWPWYHIFRNVRENGLVPRSLVWDFMGLMTAYRFASRAQVSPLGAV